MANSAGDKSQRLSDEILAGEYVLGALPIQQQKALDARMKRDHQFAATVTRWRQNITRLEIEERDNKWEVYDRIYDGPDAWSIQDQTHARRFFGAALRLWQSVIFWRTATVLLSIYIVAELSN